MSTDTLTLPEVAAGPATHENETAPNKVYVNARLWFRDDDGFRTVFFAGMSLYHFSVEDNVERKFVAVALHQAGLATQEEIANAFGIGVTTLRLWGRRHERRGLKGLGEDGRGRPKKIDATLELAIRKLVEQGHSNRGIARRLGLSEKTVRNVLKRLGIERLRHEAPDMPFEQQPEGARDEDAADEAEAPDGGEVDGEGAPAAPATEPPAPPGGEGQSSALAALDTDPENRWLDRLLARMGKIEDAVPLFGDAERVPRAGVLVALPLLVRSGALDAFMRVYRSLDPAFYGLRTTVVCLFLLALLRIKRPENLKEYHPPDLGRLLGLDRAPEVKTLRRKLKLLAAAQKGLELMRALAVRDAEPTRK